MKKVLFSIAILFTASLFLVIPANAMDEEGMPPLPTTGTPAPDLIHGEADSQSNNQLNQLDNFVANAAKAKYLKGGTSMILGEGASVRVRGTTSAFQKVTTVWVIVYLEYWNESQNKWIRVPGVQQRNLLSNYAMATGIFSVPKGNYYRTRSEHRTSQSGVVETMVTTSTYIYLKK